MKKLLFFLSLVSIGLSATADNWQATKVLSLPHESTIETVYDSNSTNPLSWAYKTTDGNNVTICILDKNLNVTEQFTIFGIIDSDTYIRFINFYGGNNSLIAFKNVFTNDGKWCVAIESSKTEKTRIYNQDSQFIGEIPEETFYCSINVIPTLDSGDTEPYILIDGDKEQSVYRFTGSSGVTKVAENKAVNAYPNPVRRGEALTVSLPQVADANTTVNVMDLNGILVYNGKVAAGTETVAIPTDNLPLGILLYSISSPVGKPLMGKICVE